ncbi:hypothetical protein G3N59_11695 [Paraburkholderia sp. Ac-20340]|uniref:hypothetical protein n=1 Tax=Paraburkholderia sp. Ac-20340 TaxID=2703888 RepID=UPI00197D0FB7|nr:hypothetical protein [Paraburkholderia sp. Ac-20340]MBN3854043.1 hypothetical protein [Paraburkholderia sp. Ac-20340]
MATVILSTDATSDGEAVPEFTSVPRTRDIFRPIAEFEGVKLQTVEASTRMVHVEHGVLTNLLDATIRKYLPEHCVTEQNGNVDIAIRRDGKVLAIFECKSNPGNISDALYKGIGQLFVYRCLLKVPQAKLALVLPNKLTSDRKTHTEIMDELGIEVFYGDSEGNFESPRGYSLGDWLANVVLAGTAKD